MNGNRQMRHLGTLPQAISACPNTDSVKRAQFAWLNGPQEQLM